ncbi:hypothetical protein ACFFKB_15330 [Mameliella alba]|uniref:hypothetical protein n=2 Tax=Mameliella alba TaxID=561184 RepID=UPI001054BC23|nr:hypothetical protein [Mameliella alba]
MTSTFDAICPSLTRMPVSFPSGALVQGSLPSDCRAAKKMNFSAFYDPLENMEFSVLFEILGATMVEINFPYWCDIGFNLSIKKAGAGRPLSRN